MLAGDFSKEHAPKPLYASEIPGGNRIFFKISKDRQGPYAWHFASLWKYGRTHLVDGLVGN
jgi:hypothetical protein